MWWYTGINWPRNGCAATPSLTIPCVLCSHPSSPVLLCTCFHTKLSAPSFCADINTGTEILFWIPSIAPINFIHGKHCLHIQCTKLCSFCTSFQHFYGHWLCSFQWWCQENQQEGSYPRGLYQTWKGYALFEARKRAWGPVKIQHANELKNVNLPSKGMVQIDLFLGCRDKSDRAALEQNVLCTPYSLHIGG